MSQKRDKCPIEITLDVLGGKWKVLILWYLLDDSKRFSELERHIPQVSQKVLTEQLRDLEENGLIERRVFPVVPPRVEYTLSAYGQTIRPILMSLLDWGMRHMSLSKQVQNGSAAYECKDTI